MNSSRHLYIEDSNMFCSYTVCNIRQSIDLNEVNVGWKLETPLPKIKEN
jgi:hypothetical protein